MDLRRQLRTAGGFGAWTVAGGLYGAKGQVAASQREVKRRLARAGRQLLFFDDRKFSLAGWGLRPFRRVPRVAAFQRKLDALKAVYEMNRGQPSPRFLAGAYWRHRDGLPQDIATANPALDGCGLLWLPPVLPFTGEAVREAVGFAEPIFSRYGFDFFVTFSTVTERALSAVMTIAYDKDSPEETEAAKACYDDLLAAMLRAGFPPYRLNPSSMQTLASTTSAYWQTVADLKGALDPAGIMAPGRYSRR